MAVVDEDRWEDDAPADEGARRSGGGLFRRFAAVAYGWPTPLRHPVRLVVSSCLVAAGLGFAILGTDSVTSLIPIVLGMRHDGFPPSGNMTAGVEYPFNILTNSIVVVGSFEDPDARMVVRLREGGSGTIVGTGYLEKGGLLVFHVPPGDYYLSTATGLRWVDDRTLFGWSTRYRRSVAPIAVSRDNRTGAPTNRVIRMEPSDDAVPMAPIGHPDF